MASVDAPDFIRATRRWLLLIGGFPLVCRAAGAAFGTIPPTLPAKISSMPAGAGLREPGTSSAVAQKPMPLWRVGDL